MRPPHQPSHGILVPQHKHILAGGFVEGTELWGSEDKSQAAEIGFGPAGGLEDTAKGLAG